jgi:hypothetical protein
MIEAKRPTGQRVFWAKAAQDLSTKPSKAVTFDG